MKYIIKCKKMSLTLICGSLMHLRITVHTGRQYTNVLADEIDKYPWYTVFGTTFGSSGSSIFFSSRGQRRQDIALQIAHCLELVFDDIDMRVDIEKVKSGKE